MKHSNQTLVSMTKCGYPLVYVDCASQLQNSYFSRDISIKYKHHFNMFSPCSCISGTKVIANSVEYYCSCNLNSTEFVFMRPVVKERRGNF